MVYTEEILGINLRVFSKKLMRKRRSTAEIQRLICSITNIFNEHELSTRGMRVGQYIQSGLTLVQQRS